MKTMRELREAANLTQAQLAKMASTSQPQINRLETGNRGLSKRWAERLAPYLHVSPQELMFPGGVANAAPILEVGGLPVVGTSRAGDWLDITMIEDREDDYENIPVARNPMFPHARQYALLVVGDSMNLIFSEGAYVTCVNFADSGLSLKAGMIVHVERTLSGRHLVETTVKKVGNGELLPMSTNPRHHPIPLESTEDTEVIVRGVVIGKWEPIDF